MLTSVATASAAVGGLPTTCSPHGSSRDSISISLACHMVRIRFQVRLRGNSKLGLRVRWISRVHCCIINRGLEYTPHAAGRETPPDIGVITIGRQPAAERSMHHLNSYDISNRCVLEVCCTSRVVSIRLLDTLIRLSACKRSVASMLSQRLAMPHAVRTGSHKNIVKLVSCNEVRHCNHVWHQFTPVDNTAGMSEISRACPAPARAAHLR